MTTLRPSLRSQSSGRPKIEIKSHNVMELLVIEEVDKQIRSLPLKTSKFVKLSDVLAYSLNRLPSLYATSKIGWERQLNRARTEFSEKIDEVVHQGIIAVQRDPLHVSDLATNSPEIEALNQELNQANNALERLKVLLQREDLSWENLPQAIEQSLAYFAAQADQGDTSNYNRARHSKDIWDSYQY